MISLLTYYYYPDKYIRFGILHFIGTITILIIPLIPFKNFYWIFLIVSLLLQNIKFTNFNNIFDIILGQAINYYNMIDYFPLIKWTPIVISGMIIGNYFDFSILEKYLHNNILSWIGKNSLHLYTFHLYILVIIYNLLKNINYRIL